MPHVFLSNSGLTIPAIAWTPDHTKVLLAFVAGIVLAIVVRQRLVERRVATGVEKRIWPFVLLALFGPALLAAALLQPEIAIEYPERGRFRLTGGAHLKPEFTALLMGLTLSASAGIAETVRSGILSVGRGNGTPRGLSALIAAWRSGSWCCRKRSGSSSRR